MDVIAFPFVWLSYDCVRARDRKSSVALRSDMFMGGARAACTVEWEPGSQENGVLVAGDFDFQ